MLASRAKALLHGSGPTLLVAAIIALREPTPLFRAEFWAEDATEFFFDAVGLGWKSLVLPVYGYNFFLCRLIAYGSTRLPVLCAPYVYAWAALVVNAVSVAYCVRDGFSWLLAKRWQRIVLAALLAIGPGTADMFLNLCGFSISLALLALWLLLERPWGLGRGKLVALLFLLPSCGHAILWLPLIGYLWRATKDRGYVVLASAIALMAAVNLWGSHQAATETGLAGYGAWAMVPWMVAEQAPARLVLAPVLGSKLTGVLFRAPAAVFWPAAALGVAALAAAVRSAYPRHRETILTLGYAYLGAIGSLVVVALSRNYAVPTLLREGGTIAWNSRYSLLPGVIGTVAWVVFLAQLDRPGILWRISRGVGLVVIAVHIGTHWGSVHPRPDLGWPEKSVEVQSILDHAEPGAPHRAITLDQLAVHPRGWVPGNHRTAVRLPAM